MMLPFASACSQLPSYATSHASSFFNSFCRINKTGASAFRTDTPVCVLYAVNAYSLTVHTLTRFHEFSSKRSPIPMPSAWMRSAAMP